MLQNKDCLSYIRVRVRIFRQYTHTLRHNNIIRAQTSLTRAVISVRRRHCTVYHLNFYLLFFFIPFHCPRKFFCRAPNYIVLYFFLFLSATHCLFFFRFYTYNNINTRIYSKTIFTKHTRLSLFETVYTQTQLIADLTNQYDIIFVNNAIMSSARLEMLSMTNQYRAL